MEPRRLTTSSKKFKIEQNVVASGSVRGIERSMDPNTVVIKRRFGEGAKPLFERDDIATNRSAVANEQTASGSGNNNKVKEIASRPRRSRSTSTTSGSPERYRRRDTATHSKPSERHTSPARRQHTPARSTPRAAELAAATNRRTPPDRVPYFTDTKRESDRLQRLYGQRHQTSSARSPKHRRHSRSRSYSPPSSNIRHVKKSSSAARRHRSPTPPVRRSYSRRDSRRRSTSSERRRSYRSSSYRRRERSRDCERESGTTVAAPTQIIIPVPVPAADFPYGYGGWQNGWGAMPMPPPQRFPGQHYHMGPMPFRGITPAPYGRLLPPPYYNGRFMFRPTGAQYRHPMRSAYRTGDNNRQKTT